jgi:hypothetical protein
MIVRLFKPQFAPLVESGQKKHTVRPSPKRIPKAGEEISLRTWTGLPYRSKQRELARSTVARVEYIHIHHDGIRIDRRTLNLSEEWEFVRADGFNTPKDFLEWFNVTHGLPFEGIVIHWQ